MEDIDLLLLQPLIKKIKEQNLDVDIEKVIEAYILAYGSHIGQKRRSGEDYILHPLEVAEILADMEMDTDAIIAGILHDVVEDTLIPLSEIEYIFGESVKKLVDGVTKLRNLPKTDSKKIENIRKMVVAMNEDIRVVIIKLADRLHNMRTLKYMTPEKQLIKSKETLDVFAPIAHRIGMARIKWELEDISFHYLYPKQYNEISDLVNGKREERENYTRDIIEKIQKELKKQNIKAEITGRPKHLYSIYKKMIEKEKKFDELNDLIAIRIIIDDDEDKSQCYNILGIIHNLFVPVSGRFKDYIAVPKSNGYQSIHTTIKGINNQNVEIQIRTVQMHRIAEEGVAAHWKYKEKKSKTKDDEYYATVKRMIEAGSENPKIFAETVTQNVLSQAVFVFTPKGEVVELPRGSTVLDFAFQVHTQIGYRTIGAKVNDKIVQLDQKLENSDKIEILTSKSAKGPGKDWINMVNNHSSRVKIRKWFRDVEFEEKSKEGKQILEKKVEKLGMKLKDFLEEEKVFLFMKKYNISNYETLFYRLSVKDDTLDNLLHKFEFKEEKKLEQVLEEETEKGNRRKEKSQGGIKISGTENTMYRLARCCSPLPGDEICGYVTRGRGIAIHRVDCENVKSLIQSEPGREVEVYWDEEEINKGIKYQYNFTLKVYDRDGILLEIIKVLNDHRTELLNVNTNFIKENGNRLCLVHLGIMINQREDLERISNSLVSMKDVIEIIHK